MYLFDFLFFFKSVINFLLVEEYRFRKYVPFCYFSHISWEKMCTNSSYFKLFPLFKMKMFTCLFSKSNLYFSESLIHLHLLAFHIFITVMYFRSEGNKCHCEM